MNGVLVCRVIHHHYGMLHHVNCSCLPQFSFFLNLSVTCWLAVGRLSVTCRSTDGRQLADRFFGELFFTITIEPAIGKLKFSRWEIIKRINYHTWGATCLYQENVHTIRSQKLVFKINFISNKSLNNRTFSHFKRFLTPYRSRVTKIQNFPTQIVKRINYHTWGVAYFY